MITTAMVCSILLSWSNGRCTPPAFRHNFTTEDIRWVLDNHLAGGVAEEGDETTRVAVGFDRSVNVLLEVMYHELEDGTALVFQAMKCRKKWRVELGIEE